MPFFPTAAPRPRRRRPDLMSSGGHGGHGKGRRPKKHEEEEHENDERWLVSYADMLTLCFVLFVVLFSISQVNQKKSYELKKVFGTPVIVYGGSGAMDEEGTDPAQ